MAEDRAECNREKCAFCIVGKSDQNALACRLPLLYGSGGYAFIWRTDGDVGSLRGNWWSSMAKTEDELFAFLAGLGIEVSTRRHAPLFTVADSQALRGEIAGGHTKNLFLKDKKDNFFLVTVDEEAEVDLKQIHHLIGATSRVSFGKPEKLLELLGVVPGAVTVFGLINDGEKQVKIVLDAPLMENQVINAHPLTNEATTSITSGDLIRFIEATGHEPVILKVSA